VIQRRHVVCEPLVDSLRPKPHRPTIGVPPGFAVSTKKQNLSRYKRMCGFNVLHPMGWDSYGLPAERYAMRTGVHPAVVTKRNIDTFRGQVRRLGFSYDWSRELATTDPDYVRWTQWIFLKLFERGLAYQAEIAVNWCPAQNTVLANEEVKNGKYVETGDPVVRRMMRQWMLRITAYADRLLDDLEELDWPENVKAMQRNWIGRSEGAHLRTGTRREPHFPRLQICLRQAAGKGKFLQRICRRRVMRNRNR